MADTYVQVAPDNPAGKKIDNTEVTTGAGSDILRQVVSLGDSVGAKVGVTGGALQVVSATLPANVVVTGSLLALGDSVVAVVPAGFATARIGFVGHSPVDIFLNFEGSRDNGVTWMSLEAEWIGIPAGGPVVPTTVWASHVVQPTPSHFIARVAGLSHIRVFCTALTSGDVDVDLLVSAGAPPPLLTGHAMNDGGGNPLLSAGGRLITVVDNFPSSQPVTGPLTDVELRATPPDVVVASSALPTGAAVEAKQELRAGVTATGSFTANGQTLILATLGYSGASLLFTKAGGADVTLTVLASVDGGTNYNGVMIVLMGTLKPSTSIDSFTATNNTIYQLLLPSGTTHIKVSSSGYFGGTATVLLRANDTMGIPAGLVKTTSGAFQIGKLLMGASGSAYEPLQLVTSPGGLSEKALLVTSLSDYAVDFSASPSLSNNLLMFGARTTTVAPTLNDGDSNPLYTTTNGALRVDASGLPLPTGASTEATLALIKAKTDNIDVALSTRTKPADSQHVIVDNAVVDVTGVVAISGALPTGANAIGKLAANSGVDIGDVDVTSLPSIPTGANLIGKVGFDQTTPGTTNGVVVTAPLPAGTNDIGDVGVVSLPTAATGTRTQVADSASDGVILAANATRKFASIANDSTVSLYLGLGTTAVTTTNYTVRILPGYYYEVPSVFTGQIRGLWESDPNTGGAKVTELT
jgi:hypothetical protein